MHCRFEVPSQLFGPDNNAGNWVLFGSTWRHRQRPVQRRQFSRWFGHKSAAYNTQRQLQVR